MKFCPRCGGLMVPAGREGDLVILRCVRCGYTEKVPASQLQGYTIATQTPKEEHTVTTLKVSEAKRRPPKSLEEWEQEREEYREILQELLEQEELGSEE
ncbi:MAG: RNA polymerase [Crenarchaeota archaeon]|nr:RNA polymerase [Thermoproteota archaeon]